MTMPRRYSRRELFRVAGIGTGALGLGALLAACGGEPAPVGPGGQPSDASSIFDGEPAGVVDFANWPLYIDKERVDGVVTRPSLDLFKEETGIEVVYKEVIQANDEFFGKIQPQLQAGVDTGWDVIVITNGQVLARLIALNYLIPLDFEKPNFDANAGPAWKDPPFDPGNRYSMAWQSGVTGVAYNKDLTGGEISTAEAFSALFDSSFGGKIGMFADTGDLPNLTLLGLGYEPETSTPDQWQEAATKLEEQRPLVRKYYTQTYIDALLNGDLAVTMAWSGDVFYYKTFEGYDNLEFVVPDEGAIIWTDNMLIPQNAQHPVDASMYMDFVYRPEVAAMMAEWINYITPVPAAREVILEDAAAAEGDEAQTLEGIAQSPLVFPDDATLATLHTYRVLDDEEEQEWNALFQPIYQG